MEIEKTYLVQVDGMGIQQKRFSRVYLSCGRYFLHKNQGPIIEISEKDFVHMTDLAKLR